MLYANCARCRYLTIRDRNDTGPTAFVFNGVCLVTSSGVLSQSGLIREDYLPFLVIVRTFASLVCMRLDVRVCVCTHAG